MKANKFVKAAIGYRLHRNLQDQIAVTLGSKKPGSQSNAELRKLAGRLPDGPKKEFFRETLDCFEAGANRATIVMCWILVLDHLYDFIWVSHKPAFNDVLSANTDRRVKITTVTHRDDFTEIPEGKLIEFLRSARIISNDVRKILDEKLGIRNSCAHPSGIAIKPSKVVEFVDDLVENVILKYPT